MNTRLVDDGHGLGYAHIDDRSFAEVVDPRLVELRLELLRKAREWLREFERHRDPEARGHLLQTLEDLALLVRA